MPEISLTLISDEEIQKAWDDAFAKSVNFTHKPTLEELFAVRQKAIAQAQLDDIQNRQLPEKMRQVKAEGVKTVVERGDEECTGHGNYLYSLHRRQCSVCWQSFWQKLGE